VILYPTVVIGLGSTGKFVVNNAQKYLYEVLNGEDLALFKFIILETAINQQGQSWTTAGATTEPVNIKSEIGDTFHTLKQRLGDEFNWCPFGMHIDGPGAGNIRAGGRLMLFDHMEKVRGIIQSAVSDVRAAAIDDKTTKKISDLLQDRGETLQSHPIQNPPSPVILVVGTLTGGTCSGACVDLGYLLHRIAPGATREALFYMPDNGVIDTYKENSWAALSDLIYFTEHPEDYEAVWLDAAQGKRYHREGAQHAAVPPYEHVYLVTQRDRTGNEHLPYRDDPGSPLLMMGGLYIAANLLGLHDLRQGRLVDLGTRVRENVFQKTFLTHSMRGVSYPKYEISEAAACKLIADHFCEYWLSKQACWNQGRREELQQEKISKEGRDFWNKKCPSIWEGLRGGVDLASRTNGIKSGHIPDVATSLRAEITQNREGTIFREIAQNVESRRRELQNTIRHAFIETLQRKQNLQYADWFLEGIQAEIERARKYWSGLGIPTGDNDLQSWDGQAATLSGKHVDQHRSLSVNMLWQRVDSIEDDLDQMVVRLEMFLMYREFGEVWRWIDTELSAFIQSVRAVLTDVRTYATSRGEVILRSLQDRSGPLLKISRSEGEGFAGEIASLAKSVNPIEGKDFVDYMSGNYRGILALAGQSGGTARDRIFAELMEGIQPALIQELQKGRTIDIVAEIERQHVIPQVIQRAHATQTLSISTRQKLMIGQDNIPSLLLTKSTQLSNQLDELLRRSDLAFPNLKKGELSLFDHMALFYQEGGGFTVEDLLYGDDLKRSYEQARKHNAEAIDPLRLLKKHAASTDASIAKTPDNGTIQSETRSNP
jgi:hypothetical protein